VYQKRKQINKARETKKRNNRNIKTKEGEERKKEIDKNKKEQKKRK
jgi:hypothetical protein